MKSTALLLLILVGLAAVAQSRPANPTQQAQSIVAEGKRLYRSEMASWHGTDLFLAAHPNREAIGGYVSYTDGDSARCTFYAKGENPVVIGHISFDSTYDLKAARVNLTQRPLTALERDLAAIRNAATSLLNSGDSLFKSYQNTQLNLIPLIHGGEKKVYILTGPQNHGVVIIGNDYLLTFDAQNRLLTKRALHKNIIPIGTKIQVETGEEAQGSMHTHLPETGDFITATDICTLMLYSKFTNWKEHSVVSPSYLNIWHMATQQLTVVPRNTVEK